MGATAYSRVRSVFGRTGAVQLQGGDVLAALGYTPQNAALSNAQDITTAPASNTRNTVEPTGVAATALTLKQAAGSLGNSHVLRILNSIGGEVFSVDATGIASCTLFNAISYINSPGYFFSNQAVLTFDVWKIHIGSAASPFTDVDIWTSGAKRIAWDGGGNTVIGAGAMSTSATDGFIYIPTCAGPPTGTPTSYTGRVPLIYDATNDNLYIYRGGWKKQPGGAFA